ncbi:MAG: hypothetical protein AAGA03_16040 [Planctomycetota bacterium]
MRRPLILLPVPIPLNPQQEGVRKFAHVSHSQHAAKQDVPLTFRLHGKTYQIVRQWGPERIETGWWSGPSIRRDYFRVETHQGDWWWIFRDLKINAQKIDTQCPTADDRSTWMLHGRFD